MRLGLDGRILAHSYSGIGCYLTRLMDQFKKLKQGRFFSTRIVQYYPCIIKN